MPLFIRKLTRDEAIEADLDIIATDDPFFCIGNLLGPSKRYFTLTQLKEFRQAIDKALSESEGATAA